MRMLCLPLCVLHLLIFHFSTGVTGAQASLLHALQIWFLNQAWQHERWEVPASTSSISGRREYSRFVSFLHIDLSHTHTYIYIITHTHIYIYIIYITRMQNYIDHICIHFVVATAALASPLPILTRMAAIGVGAWKHVQGFDTSWPSLGCNSFCRFFHIFSYWF
jgi:hypothetical protein